MNRDLLHILDYVRRKVLVASSIASCIWALPAHLRQFPCRNRRGNNTKWQFYTYLILLFLCACSTPTKGPNPFDGEISCINIKVDLSDMEHNSVPPSSVKNCSVVRLETNDNSLIGEINKIYVTDERIYVLDSDKAKALLVFDREGKYLMTIGSRGNGPGEYYTIDDFYIDEEKRQISIFDANYRRILFYDWNGAYTGNHSFYQDVWAHACYPLDSLHYAFDFIRKARGKNKYHLQLIDANKDVYFNFKPLEYDYGFSSGHISFYKGFEDILYVPIRCDTIFKLSQAEISEGYAIDFGERKLPRKFHKDIEPLEQGKKLLTSSYCYGIKTVVETEKLLCFYFNFSEITLSCICAKETQKSYFVQWYPAPIANYKNYLVGFFNSDYIEAVKEAGEDFIKLYEDVLGKEILERMLNQDSSDNPLLFFYEIEL
jgi:hypothetical protein